MKKIIQKFIKEVQDEFPETNLEYLDFALERFMNDLDSQASDLPSDEQCDEIAFRKLLLTGRTESEEIQDRKLVIEGLTTMRSIASPILASHVARIKELEEQVEALKHIGK